MGKMSTTKSLSVKAEKPQDQTCASQAQALIDHILEDQTTGLSDAIDSAVYNSVLLGNAAIKMEGGPITASHLSPYIISTGTANTATGAHLINRAYPRRAALKHAELDSHPVFQMTTEQLRAAWMLTYGSRWIALGDINDDDMVLIMERLKALGEMEIHNVVDQYSPMGRLKL
jgi:hypothetical protein